MKFTIILVAIMLLITLLKPNSFEGQYCDVSASTDGGKSVYGDGYMWSDEYGELDSVYTEDGKRVAGECYRFSNEYCELDGAYVEDSGEGVYGECYFF